MGTTIKYVHCDKSDCHNRVVLMVNNYTGWTLSVPDGGCFRVNCINRFAEDVEFEDIKEESNSIKQLSILNNE